MEAWECVFCKIAENKVPNDRIYEDDEVVAFRDRAPQAPVHVLLIPKRHISSCDAVTAENSACLAKLFEAVPKVAQKLGLAQGYRLITNTGRHGCQSVPHLHFHLIGGKQLAEKIL